MVIRFSAFHQTLADGQFPVRFVDRLNNNYGYPVLNFLYPLPFYYTEIFKIIGFGFVSSVKLTFVTTTIASSLLMYWALSRRYSNTSSIVGAIVYLFLPYRMVDIYVRGSIGENFAFAIMPLVLAAIISIDKNRGLLSPLLVISTAALVLSHNVTAILMIPVVLTYGLILNFKNKAKIFLSIFLGLMMSSFFWLSALFDIQYVRLSQIKVSEIPDHLVQFADLIIPRWGYRSLSTGVAGFSPQLGLISTFVFTAAVILFLRKKLTSTFLKINLLIYILVVILMSVLSKPLWEGIPTLDIIQFPWRLLSVSVVVSAILAAELSEVFKEKKYLIYAFAALTVLLSLPYIHPRTFVNKPDSYYATNEDTTTVRNEYLPVWVTENKPRVNSKIDLMGDAKLISSSIRYSNYVANIEANEDINVKINTVYFPGFTVKANNNYLPIDYISDGLINFKLPKGNSTVIIEYGKTTVHLISEIISAISLLIIILYSITLWRKQNS